MFIDKKICYLILLCMLPFVGLSQQLPQFSNYMVNTMTVNPAYAGSRERLNVTFLNRNQWVGINGAPVTQTFSAHSAVPGKKLGVGLSLVHDKLGYENTTFIYADVSYTININEDYRLSFGLKAGFSKYGLDSELLMDPTAVGDQYLDKIFNRMKPNFGFGLFYRSDDWFMSISSPRILTYNNNTDIEYTAIERSSYYINGGYMLKFNPQLRFKPTFLIKYTNGAPVSFDLTGNFLINEKLWLGAAYRFGDGLGGLISLQATDNMKFGYSYEFITSDINPYTSGSHEIFITYEFDFPKPRCNCENNF